MALQPWIEIAVPMMTTGPSAISPEHPYWRCRNVLAGTDEKLGAATAKTDLFDTCKRLGQSSLDNCRLVIVGTVREERRHRRRVRQTRDD